MNTNKKSKEVKEATKLGSETEKDMKKSTGRK